MRLLKQSTQRELMVFMVDSADHVTGKTGLTLTITASKDGAAFASITPTVTERGNGWYSLTLTTTHTNTLGDLAIHITASGADPTDTTAQVVADLPGATVASVTGAVGSVTGAVGSVTGAVGSVTGNVGGNVGGNVTGSVGSIAAGGITAASIASDAITAAKVAADAVAEIQSGLATSAALAGVETKIDTIDGIVDAILVDTGTDIPAAIDAVDNFVDTEVAAIKAKTDNLPSDPADASDIAGAFSTVNSTLATLATYVDTEVAAIKAKTDLIPASPASVGDCITAAGVRTAVGLASANLDTQLGDLPTNAELTTALAGADDATLAAIASLNNITAASVWAVGTRTLTAATNITSTGGTTVPQTGDAYGRLGAPAGASVSADIAAVKAETAAIVDDTGTSGVVVASASKTGYALASTGLDAITTTAPASVASNFREMMVQLWRRLFKKAVYDGDANTVKTYADDGTTVITTQNLTNSNDVQTQGPAS